MIKEAILLILYTTRIKDAHNGKFVDTNWARVMRVDFRHWAVIQMGDLQKGWWKCVAEWCERGQSDLALILS